MKSRKTKQQDIILQVIKNDKSHPTIYEIYQKVSEINPKIGQATIYRNINKLVENGEVIRISSSDNMYHYDGECNTHEHFICQKCHRIIDLYENDYQEKVEKIEKKYSIKIEQTTMIYKGICKDCRKML